ncbi:MAG: hypothetical protein IT338_10105 [Thermomicrobiales bacterium]|nr:hypothetical protein [Thermomicrobiales bacterium]
MDDHRFDDLARAVAGGGSRRGLLRGLAGAAALLVAGRATKATAHHGRSGPGDPCRTDSDCVAADAPMICSDNGFTYDGLLNCCTFEGSRCGFDEACCGDAVCLNGVCTRLVDYPAQGERCTDVSVCVAADTAVTCDYVMATGDYRCCAYEGSRCNWDGGCCGSASCINGFCSSSASLAGPGERCQSSSQCVAADTALTCDYIGQTDDFRCCAYEGGRCGWDGGCCGWLRCSDSGFCTGVPPSGCDGEGCECDFHDPSACAPGLVCCAVQSGFICATRRSCGG